MADASQGNDPPNGSQGGDAPKYVTEEQLNKAITGRLNDWSKSFEKKNAETIKSAVGEISPALDKLLEEKLSAFRPKTDDAGAKDGAKVDIENHPAFKGLKKQLDESANNTRKLQEERDAERARASAADLRDQVGKALAKHGVPSDRLTHAVGHVINTAGLAKWNEDRSAVVFGDLDLETGTKDWLKNDEAKIYLPPRGTQGSGDRGGGQRPARQAGYQRGALGAALLEEYAPGVTVVSPGK